MCLKLLAVYFFRNIWIIAKGRTINKQIGLAGDYRRIRFAISDRSTSFTKNNKKQKLAS